FFPEWEAEGFQAILGLPLLTASAGQQERRLLGVIILADANARCFDEDRVRRLHAAADYVAAVIAEARLHRELEAAQRRAAQDLATAGERTAEVRAQLERTKAQHEDDRLAWETRQRARESEHAGQVAAVRTEAHEERERLVAEYDAKLDAQAQATEALRRQSDEALRVAERSHAERLAGVQREAEEKRDRLIAEYDGKLKEQADRLHDLRQSFEETRRRTDSEHAECLAAIQAESKAERERLIGEYEDKLKAQVDRFDDLRRSSEETRRRMDSEQAERLAAIQAETKAERERLIGEYENKLKAQADRLDALSRTFEETRQALAGEHAEHLAAVRAEAKSERERLASEYHAELKTHDGKLDDLNRHLEETRRAMASQAAAFEDERREWSERVREWEQLLAAAHTELQDRESVFTKESQRVAGEIERLRAELSDQHRIYEERMKALMARLDDERRATAAENERDRERLQSLKDDFAARENAWQAERDEERRQAAEREKQYADLLATERTSHQEAVDEWNAAKGELLSRVDNLEEQFQHAHAERAAAIEGMREEWSQERTQSRERLRALTDRLHAAQKSVRDAAACLRDPGPRETAVARLLPRLPGGTQVFVWQRRADGSPRLLMAHDRDGVLGAADAEPLTPWAFETDTIPAEGPHSLPDALHWAAMESEHDPDHVAVWDAVWGNDRRPQWAVCWPWGSGGGPGDNGWVTAFGFSEVIPSAERIDGLATFAEIIGALAVRPDRVPTVETEQPETVAEEEFPDPVVEETKTVGLHDALIAWVADQQKDGWRLELSASRVPPVASGWLTGILDRGHQSCRANGGDQNNEFLIATETTNGRTTLRLVNTHTFDSGDPDFPEHRDDRTLDGDAAATTEMPPVAGRWLVSGERYLGLEMIFENQPEAESEERVSWENGTSPEDDDRLNILIADSEEAMRELLVGMLETLGHDAVGARDSQDACRYFEAQQFDVVVVNADMPQRSGIALAEWVKSGAPHVPVILVTEEGCDDPSFNGIADCMLRKPFRLDQLQECLESVAPAAAAGADHPGHEHDG
ncbi:MAG TPA: response regulator, partial [Acidobacteriota bacterium]|nr:response regulator [Acidobacteriota bacterium]